MKLFLASGFYFGLAPIVPGSFGALPGLALWMIGWYLGFDSVLMHLWVLVWIVVFSLAHYALTPWAQKYWGNSDPKHFVLDEVVGTLCVPLFSLSCTTWWQPITGFCIYRILDAIKLPGARYIDRNIHTANGVLFDDVVSAMYSAIILSVIIYST